MVFTARRPTHLVVSAAPGVQLLPRFPCDLRQSPLVRRVDVLISRLFKGSSIAPGGCEARTGAWHRRVGCEVLCKHGEHGA